MATSFAASGAATAANEIGSLLVGGGLVVPIGSAVCSSWQEVSVCGHRWIKDIYLGGLSRSTIRGTSTTCTRLTISLGSRGL